MEIYRSNKGSFEFRDDTGSCGVRRDGSTYQLFVNDQVFNLSRGDLITFLGQGDKTLDNRD